MKKSFFGLIILFIFLTTYTPKFDFIIGSDFSIQKIDDKIKIDENKKREEEEDDAIVENIIDHNSCSDYLLKSDSDGNVSMITRAQSDSFELLKGTGLIELIENSSDPENIQSDL